MERLADSRHPDPDMPVRPSEALYAHLGCLNILGQPLMVLSSKIFFIRTSKYYTLYNKYLNENKLHITKFHWVKSP